MNVIDHIATKFFDGKIVDFADFAEVSPTTAGQWKKRNSIRQEHQRRILTKSDAQELGISPNDFFPDRLKVEV